MPKEFSKNISKKTAWETLKEITEGISNEISWEIHKVIYYKVAEDVRIIV